MQLRIFLWFIAVALAAGSGRAQGPVVPPSDMASGIVSQAVASGGEARKFEQLLDWESWLGSSLKRFEQDSMARGAAEAESCISRARALDIFLPAYGHFLQQQAGELIGRQGRSLADTLGRLALEADPTKLSHIIAARRLGHLRRSYSLGLVMQDVSQALDFFNPRLLAASHLLIWASLLAMAWAGLFCFYLWARHLPQGLHFLSERLPAIFTLPGRTLVAAAAVAGLVIIGAALSLPLTAGIAALTILPRCSKKEKVLAALSVIILVIAGVGLGLGFRMMKIQEQGYLPLLDEANHSPEAYRLRARLMAEQSARPDDLKPLFALALLKERSDDQSGAESYYRQLLELRPDNALAVNNIGNLYFRRGLLDSAQEMYAQAIALDKRLAVAHYNLGQVFFLKLRFPEGRKELELAAALDPKQMTFRSGQAAGGLVLDALIPRDVLWSNIWNGWNIGEGFDRRDAWILAGPGGWLPAAGAILLAVLFPAILILARRAGPGQYCRSCGRPVCSKCAQGEAEESFCPFCAQKIYAAQSPELRDKVIRSLSPQIERRRLIRAAAANALLPGSAWSLAGRPWLAWFWSFLWAAVYATWRAWILDLYPARALKLYGLGAWVLILPAVLLYLLPWLGLTTATRRGEKP